MVAYPKYKKLYDSFIPHIYVLLINNGIGILNQNLYFIDEIILNIIMLGEPNQIIQSIWIYKKLLHIPSQNINELKSRGINDRHSQMLSCV